MTKTRIYALALLMSLSVATPLHAAPSTVFHTVIFWLKADTPAGKLEEIIANTKSLESLPMVEKVYVGQPIMSPREVVDDSFSVAFTMVFKDEAALKAYNADPRHKKSSSRALPHVARGVIYDYKFD
ncbi:MAG: Dabb family protein [Alphaproteobacteria bacterium]|jgi:hypothetical protein|nr:Dabb family protein [Alphaproteobacteria bacterium]